MGIEPSAGADPLGAHSLSGSELKELLAAERAGEAFLVFRDEEAKLHFFDVAGPPGGATQTVGRRAETDLPLPWDSEVSGVHAELQHLGGEVTILDDGLSRNGTYVNGERVSGRQRLRDGDRIRLGRTTLVYRAAHAVLLGETEIAGTRQVPQLTDTQRRVLLALCRPHRDGSFATPATNQEIAAEVFLSVDAVKMHLRTLFGKFELGELAQNQKRARLAELALQLGVVTHRDLA
jgi:pSer/pThr/pTyr-binding forkhead associated (FHA) protein